MQGCKPVNQNATQGSSTADNGHQNNPARNSKKYQTTTDFQAKYKTVLCKNWEAGFCEFGDKCVFAHGQNELRDRSNFVNYKSEKCKKFYGKGYCTYGPKCQFKHREKASKINASAVEDHNACEKRLPIFKKLEQQGI